MSASNADTLFDRLLEDPEVRAGYDEQDAIIKAVALLRAAGWTVEAPEADRNESRSLLP